MKFTLDGPCAELEKKATLLPPKYFDKKATDALEYCKNVTCPFKEAARRVAQFVSTIQHYIRMHVCVWFMTSVLSICTLSTTVILHPYINFVVYQLR